jgi:cobalt-zinc-cadmium efflux system outer membrane protein
VLVVIAWISVCLATAAAGEPTLFTPARDLTALEAEAPSQDLPPSILPQAFVVGEELVPEALPETLPEPAAERVRPPGAVPPPPPKESTVPGVAIDDRDQPLTLCEVLQSVMLHYPLLQAVERERSIAAGRVTTAMGAFDTNVSAQGSSLAPGTYQNYRSDLGVSRLLPYGGMNVFGGYRTGYGDFTTYNLQQLTADGGEWRGGITVPLAKNRDIDRPRASRAQAELDTALAEPIIQRTQLDYMRAAARTYWNWLGSGQRRTAAGEVVEAAAEFEKELAIRVQLGASANIDRIDNQQNLALRQAVSVQADRAVQQATIDLSLFHRDPQGRPLLAGKRRLQPVPMPFEPPQVLYEQTLARALAARPEFQRLSLQREKLLVERRLAENQTLPGIDSQIVGNQDAGFGTSKLSGPNGLDRQVLQAQLVFQMPAERRDARGRIATVQAQMSQIERQLQYAEDQIRAEVQDAYSALERGYEFHKQALQRMDLARTVWQAEREQVRLGRSDVLRVTLREQAAFDAQIYEITARQEFWRSESDLRAADASLGPESCGFPAQGLLECP